MYRTGTCTGSPFRLRRKGIGTCPQTGAAALEPRPAGDMIAAMPRPAKNASHDISTLNEKPLHAALKRHISRAYDEHEVLVDGFLIDIVRGDLLIEVQTRNFSASRRKLTTLVAQHRVGLVHPIARDRWIVRESADGRKQLGRRRSPKHGAAEDIFEELVSIPALMGEANFSLEVLVTQEEEVRRQGKARAWRRGGWSVHARRLLDVLESHVFETPADLAALLPDGLPEPFTTADLAAGLARPRPLAQAMAYCLREMGAIRAVGKKGNTILYTAR